MSDSAGAGRSRDTDAADRAASVDRRSELARRRTTLGARGEQAAAAWLESSGYDIVGRNVRVGHDEIDIVALDPRSGGLVIVEVKTRRGRGCVPEEAVGREKQQKLVRATQRLRRQRGLDDRPVRFDVVAITLDERDQPDVRHLRSAFDAS